MKHREPPARKASPRQRRQLGNDRQVKRWSQRILGDPDAKPYELSEDQLALVAQELLKRRGVAVGPGMFERILEKTKPVLFMPDLTDPIEDLGLIFQLEEMQDFWHAWQRPDWHRGSRGPNAADETRKALMATMAIPGWTTHAQKAHWILENIPRLQQVFEGVAAAGAARAGTNGPGPFEPLTYPAAMRRRDWMSEPVPVLAMQTNIELIRSLRELHGDRVGIGLLIDGSAIPAWAPQVSSNGNDELEGELRRFAPEAGFRAIQHTSNGKVDIDNMPDKQLRSGIKGGKGKAWRGYYLVVIVEQATGLPLVWTLIDSKQQETTALTPLLSLLYQLWPDCPAEWIAGDSAFDTDPCCRVCEVDYELHPIFRLHDEGRGAKDIPRDFVQGDKLLQLTADGHLLCAAHGAPTEYEGLERPGREKLKPGQANREEGFRYRVECKVDARVSGGPAPCNRMSLPAMFDYSKLTYFPHHPDGRPTLFAMRQVLLSARLGQVESCFQALKGSHLLGGTGAGRSRIRERHVHEALISLAFLGRTALTVVDQRQQAGLFKPKPLPAAPTPAKSPAMPAVSPNSSELTSAVASSPVAPGVPHGITAMASL